MKKIVFILCLFPSILFGQEVFDTIPHTNGECINSELYNSEGFDFNLCNDTLKFYGKIFANCGGNHFLIYSRQADNTIVLTKLDTGQLEDCMCLYHFDISIPECKKNKHRLILENYSGNDIIVDTLITSATSSTRNQKKNKLIIYPNPSIGLINIKFPKIESNIKVKIYDYDGKCLFNKLYPYSANVIINESLSSGVYIIKINSTNINYSNKLIIK